MSEAIFQRDGWTQREDWTAFRTLDGCARMAGVSTTLLGRLVAKELADNALDAGGACRVGGLPSGGFYVEDDGSGIPGDDAAVAALFSIGRPLTSTKMRRLPTRGALGNGLRVVAGAVLASQGALTVRTGARSLRLTPRDDGATTPQNIGHAYGPGTRIEVALGKGAPDDPDVLAWAEQAVGLAGAGKGYLGKSSPWWYDDESFWELLQASGGTARAVVSGLEGCG